MAYVQPKFHPGKWDTQTSLGFWETNRSPNLRQTDSPSDSQHNTCWIVDFPKFKTERKRNMYQYLAWKLKKLRNIKVMVVLVVIGALGTVTKGLVQRLEDLKIRERVETIQTVALSWARILWRVLETWGLLSLKTSVEDHQLMLVWKTLKGVK